MKKNQNEEKKSKKDKNICSSKQIKENNENHNKKTGINEICKIEINPTQKKTQNKKRTKAYREEKRNLNESDLNSPCNSDKKYITKTKPHSKEKIDINKVIKNKTIIKIISKERAITYYLIIIFIFSIIAKSIPVYLDRISNDHYITLKIGKGRNKFLGDEQGLPPYSHPNEVFINGDKQSSVQNYYTFTREENTVKLVWKYIITSCLCMFTKCNAIIEMDLSHFNTGLVTDMGNMFSDCSGLKSIDLTGLDTSSVTVMAQMFFGCNSLTTLDLSSFNVNRVYNMGNMFAYCKSLKSLNLNNFRTTSLKYVDNFFNDCESLTSVYFPNFDSSVLENMANMFSNCKKLEYVNLKNYYTSKSMERNYYFSESPKNLVVCIRDSNLKSIITSHICNVVSCETNWYDYQKKIDSISGSCVENCALTSNKYEYNNKCYFKCITGTYNDNFKCKECHSDCRECDEGGVTGNTNCLSCSLSSKYLYLGNCLNNCQRNSYFNESINQNMCKCELAQCFTCSKESLNKNLCTSCENENGYFPVYGNSDNPYAPYYNCSKSPEGFYLDNIIYVYKYCHFSCKKCDIYGDEEEHNCVECKGNYNYEMLFDKYKNCYEICPIYFYYDENDNKYYCTKNAICPTYYDKLIEPKNECVSNCTKDDIYKYEFRKKCYVECPENSTERDNTTILFGFSIFNKYFCKPICFENEPFEIMKFQQCVKNCPIKFLNDLTCILDFEFLPKNKNYYDEEELQKEKFIRAHDIMLENAEFEFTLEEYDTTLLKQGFDEILNYYQMTITLTTVPNQRSDMNNSNVTAIDIKECENILREKYNISNETILYMKKIEVMETGMKIPKIEFDIYSRLNGTHLIKLDLSFCSNINIDISYPVLLDENIEIHNSSSDYYNDLCYPTTSEYGTDITLTDRRKNFIEKNKTVCQEKCVFIEYNYNLSKSKCSCDITESSKSSKSFVNIHINKTKLYDNFINIRNIANINLLFCYKLLFPIKGILHNYGCLFIFPIIIIHFILMILFCAKNSYNKIIDKIKEIKICLLNSASTQPKKNPKRNLLPITTRRKTNKGRTRQYLNNISSIRKGYNNIRLKFKKNLGKKIHSPIKKRINLNLNNKNKTILQIGKNNNKNQNKKKANNKFSLLNRINTNNNKKSRIKQNKDKEKTKKIMSYNNSELNDLSYDLALKFDKRSYCIYYISLLKTKHDFITTFFNNTDYNSKIIKTDLLFFNFVLSLTINALFFTDNTMSKIYEDEGDFNFIYNLPQIIYSTIISVIFGVILKKLALSEKAILNFKRMEKKINIDDKMKSLSNKLKIKFILYFILSTIFILCFWFYICMFCMVYSNTQLYLIKDTSLSFVLSQIYSFGINAIPGIFRIPSLSNPNNKRKCLYLFSKILQIF